MPLLRRALWLLLAAALSSTARAGVVSPAGPVFSSPAGAWAGPLGVAFADPTITPFLPPAFGSLSLTAPESLRATAPLVHSLAQNLGITPKMLAKMAPSQRQAAIELASEEARQTVRAATYELAETARALAKPGRAMDKESRAELYHTVAKLMEMREFYGPWLEDELASVVEDSYKAVSLRAWEIRTSLLEGDAPAVASAVKKGPLAAVAPAYVLSPSAYAVKLREDMANTKSGWGQDDLHDLYVGYGFVLRQGGKHRFYSHPSFPQLTQSVSRQNDLPPGYAQSALKLITELEKLVADQQTSAGAPVTGPPATLTLADLSVLLSPSKTKIEKPARKIALVYPEDAVKTPEPVLSVIAENSVAEETLVPAVRIKPLVQLEPATLNEAEQKPEPPSVEVTNKPADLLTRFREAWRRFRGD